MMICLYFAMSLFLSRVFLGVISYINTKYDGTEEVVRTGELSAGFPSPLIDRGADKGMDCPPALCHTAIIFENLFQAGGATAALHACLSLYLR